jgi:hypothetical protein
MRSTLAVRKPLRRLLLILGAAVLVAMTLPAVADAAGRPTPADLFEARAICNSERGTDIIKRSEFLRMYAGPRPFRRCVRRHARLIALERAAEVPQITAKCQAEALTDPAEFALEYPGPNGVEMCVLLETLP